MKAKSTQKGLFQFKQFAVYQDKTAMKIGTDGVILGAWTKASSAHQILDIGSGTGLISLMLAQQSKAEITAIEKNPDAAAQTEENFKISPWANKLHLIKADFFDYAKSATQKFDLIVCNPPYFQAKLEQTNRTMARQNEHLPFDTLFSKVERLLTKEGHFNLIFPSEFLEKILKIAEENKLYPHKILRIKGNESVAVKRAIIQFSKMIGELIEEELVIEKGRHKYTEDYANLLQDYLLIF